MGCIFCYDNPISITNAKTQARKGLIFYMVTTLKKHVYANHCVIAIFFKEKVNNLLEKTS
jgi:hypothetical protein